MTRATNDRSILISKGAGRWAIFFGKPVSATRCRAIGLVQYRREGYIAVTTGLGGGSPEEKPTDLLREVHRPSTGQELYVFALPEKH